MSASKYDLEGNTFFAAAYGALIVPQVYLGIRYKTWGFLFGMVSGLVLEVVGYTGRILLHHGHRRFSMYIIPLTIGPAFFSAAIYLCLARIIMVFGEHLARFQPRVYTVTFMLLDLFALVLQAGGGVLVSGAEDPERLDTGLSVLQAGLSVHLVGIVIYVALSAEFAYRTYTRRVDWNPRFNELQTAKKFKAFMIVLVIATVCILIRTAFRVAELSQGFESDLAEDETAFFVLEGAMVLTAALALTICHPGPAFQNRWPEADFELKSTAKNKNTAVNGSENSQ